MSCRDAGELPAGLGDPCRWITINSYVNICDDMEGAQEALEDFAREAVALYGRDAPKMLLQRADIADEHGDELSAKTWRQVAAIASRITRRTPC